MKLKTIFAIHALAAVALLASFGTASASPVNELLTFDNLSFDGLYVPVPGGYGGLQWNNFEVLNTVQELNDYGPNGEVNGMVSPNNVIFNDFGNPSSLSDGSAFDLNSAYLAGVWNDGMQLEVQGFVGTTLAYDNTYTLSTQGPTLIDFNYDDVDEVNFIASGGTPHGYPFGHGTQFSIDNMNVTLNPVVPVPEPPVEALVWSAAVLLGLRCLMQRQKVN
jgi:hypothetical protein